MFLALFTNTTTTALVAAAVAIYKHCISLHISLLHLIYILWLAHGLSISPLDRSNYGVTAISK